MPKVVLERKDFVPEGYVPLKDNGISVSTAYKMQRNGVDVIRVDNSIYVFLRDLEGYKQAPEGFLSLEDAAQESGYSAGYLWRLARQQRIGSRKHRKMIYVSASDLEGYR